MNGGEAIYSHLAITISPLVDTPVIAAIAVPAIMLAVLAVFRLRHGLPWRIAGIAILVMSLLNPSVLEEEREPVSDIAAVIVDRSLSQKTGERTKVTDDILAEVKKKLEETEKLEVRYPEVTSSSETNIFAELDKTLADVPEKRRAGAIIISDGQIHDVPEKAESDYGPLHLLLTGREDEKDRRLVIREAPAYGIVGKSVKLRYLVKDSDIEDRDSASITMRPGNGEPVMDMVETEKEHELELEITQPGQNVFEISAGTVEGELSEINNKATVIVNGIRDRLRVLLVSGLPYIGERTWRDILTSDPGIDLIHFTILRDPSKIDSAPKRELSLIPFPFRELFEAKLDDFDLIIFDRYRLNKIMPLYYFSNIARYVRSGGALLAASGPAFTGEQSIASTPLSSVLPAEPEENYFEKAYQPQLTEYGTYHPVTRTIADDKNLGNWLRQIGLKVNSGKVLMEGINGGPLLILDSVQEGRVAQIASDQIWLWAKNYDGGGPYAEILRRLIHWLMKEPELEEDALIVKTEEKEILVKMRDVPGNETEVTLERPDGSKTALDFPESREGWKETVIEAHMPGIYTFKHNGHKQFASVGSLNPKELGGIIASEKPAGDTVRQTGGGVYWSEDSGVPDIKMLARRNEYSGRSWIGLRDNNHYKVTGVSSRPLIPAWAAALLILSLMIAGWWKEGRE
jgi:hypothetical protein